MVVLTQRRKGIFAMILLAFVFSMWGTVARYLSHDFTIFQQTYLRVGAAFLLSFIIFYKDLDFTKLLRISRKDWMVLVFRSTVLYVFGVTLVSQAFLMTTYSNVSFVAAVPTTALLGFVLLREKVVMKKILYILLGFVGVAFIAVKDLSQLSWGDGELLAFIAAFGFSFSYIARKWESKFLTNKEIEVLIFFISTVLLMLTSLLFFQEGLPTQADWNIVLVAVIVGAGLWGVLDLFLTNYGFQKVDAVLAGNILTLEAFFALILSVIFYHEVPTAKELMGGIIIVLCVIQMNRLKR